MTWCAVWMCVTSSMKPSDVHVNDCEGDDTDDVTGVTLLRDDAAEARAEEMAWYEKFKAHEEVTDETCVSRTGRKPISCRWRDINKGDNERVEVRSRLVAREIKRKEDRQPLHRKTTVSTRTLRDKKSRDIVENGQATTTHGA